MSVLRSLESKLAGLVEGTFSRAFKSEVRPVEIARKLAKEMDQHKVQSLSRVYAPNEYAVWLSPDDRQQFEGTEDELASELSGYLLEHARRERITLGTSPRIVFKTDEKLRLGEFGIQARRVKPPQHASTRRPSQADEGHTMVYSVRRARPGAAARARPAPRPRAAAGGRAAPSSSAPRAPCSAARATPTSCSTIPTSPATTPRSGRPAGRGSSTTSGSTNGIKVNGRRVNGPQSLKRGDVIEIGTSRVTFELE